MIDINFAINRLLHYGLQQGLIEPEDTVYTANRLLYLLGLSEFAPVSVEETLESPAPVWRICSIGRRKRQT